MKSYAYDHLAIADAEAASEPAIDVGSSYRAWWFLTLAAVALCLVVAGSLLSLAQADGGLPVLIAGGALGFVTALVALSIAARKLAVRITPDGFIVHDRHGERGFTDEQVICASLYSTANFVNGEQKSTTRTFDLWVEGESGAERLKMVNRIALGRGDPLDLLIERILGHLYDRAEAALDARESFEGEGWSLHRNELAILRKRTTDSVPLAELSAAEVFDNDLCVWKHGQDEPAARISICSANAPVLLRLLQKRITGPDEPAAPVDTNRLGRILFERRPGRAHRMTLWLLPLSAVAIVAGALIAGLAGNGFDGLIVAAALALGLGCLWLLALSQTVWLRCHEHGVSRRWLWWEKRVKYGDVQSFTYTALRQYVKGVYSGTTFTLTFVASVGGKALKVTYSKTLRNADNELDHLRDHVSRVIAARMAEQFGLGSAVSWTNGLRFLHDGLEYRASSWLGRKAPVMLRYDQIAGVDVSSGIFHLWVNGQKKPAIKEQVGQPNFFPGYLFLVRLLALRTAEAVPGR